MLGFRNAVPPQGLLWGGIILGPLRTPQKKGNPELDRRSEGAERGFGGTRLMLSPAVRRGVQNPIS